MAPPARRHAGHANRKTGVCEILGPAECHLSGLTLTIIKPGNPAIQRPPDLRKMDRVTIISPRLFLSADAADRDRTVAPFNRWVGTKGRERPHTVTIALECHSTRLLTLVSHALDDGRWRVTRSDVNLPSLIWGHNGRALRSAAEVALAWTRARYFIKIVTEALGHDKIIPGTGRANLGFVRTAELMVQIQDPDHRLLRATHQTRLPHQHKPTFVAWGRSSDFNREDTRLRIYDKVAQRTGGRPNPMGGSLSRLEFVAKRPERLGRETGYALQLPPAAGDVISTLTLDDAYAVIRLNFRSLIGLNTGGNLGASKLSKTARLLMLGLATGPYAVERLLDDYRDLERPSNRCYGTIDREVRNAAASRLIPDFDALLPETLDSLAWADVEMPGTEGDYLAFLRDMGAPSEPDPDILAAWSRTSFLKSKPCAADLTGPVMPCRAPWRQTF